MAEKPSTLPVWATTPGTTTTPSGGQQAAGFAAGTKPPAKWVNWILNLIYGWIQYLDAPTGTGSAAGLKGTGGSTDGPGLWGVGGATNGRGVLGQGVGSGTGVRGEGGTSGVGVRGVGGSAGGNGGNFTATAGDANGITATGQGAGSGFIGTGGATSGTGGHTVGGATDGNGFEGEAVGSGTGVWGHSPAGYGVIAESDTTSPTKAALRIVPQDTDPSSPALGDLYLTSNGEARSYQKPHGASAARWGAVGELQFAQVPLTAAQIKNLAAVPFTIVAAQGVNTIINLVKAAYKLTHVTTAMAAGDDLYLAFDDGGLDGSFNPVPYAASQKLDKVFLTHDVAADIFVAPSNGNGAFGLVYETTTGMRNNALKLTLGSGVNFTTGDSTLLVSVWYTVMPV